MRCLLDPGDEVLIASPYFSNYAQTVMLCGGETIPVRVYEKDDFVSDTADLGFAAGGDQIQLIKRRKSQHQKCPGPRADKPVVHAQNRTD